MSNIENEPKQVVFEADPEKRTFLGTLRTYFLTGLVVSAPIFITFYLVMWFVGMLDGLFRPLIPVAYRPETYLPFDIPGVGVVLAFVTLTIIGGLAANLLGRSLVSFSDRVIGKLPVVGSVYTALKQIFKTAVRQDSASFSQVALIEYPRKGLYCIAFVTKDADQRVRDGAGGKEMVAVFLPTTPNPTSGFLLFVPKDELVVLDMTIEEGARLVISAGLSDEEGD
ncbi:DUF502 domain-containing protein [Alphaproteobacteria bacterium]|nr:DUF502 domain-containing protein [Alphaproteobacteria bacterium]